MSEGILLPGWSCTSCGAFNGSAKERRTTCRVCDEVAPPTLAEVLARDFDGPEFKTLDEVCAWDKPREPEPPPEPTIPRAVGLALALALETVTTRMMGTAVAITTTPTIVAAQLDRTLEDVLVAAGLHHEVGRWRTRVEWRGERRTMHVDLVAASSREPEHPKTVPAPPPSGPITAGD